MRSPYRHMRLGARAKSKKGEELSEREAFMQEKRQVHLCSSVRVRPPRGTVYIVQLLSSVRLQFLSGSVVNVMCTGMFLCTAAADDGDGLGNASET